MRSHQYRLASFDALDGTVLKLIKRKLVLLWLDFGPAPVSRTLVAFGRDELVCTVLVFVALAYKISAVVADPATLIRLMSQRELSLLDNTLFLALSVRV